MKKLIIIALVVFGFNAYADDNTALLMAAAGAQQETVDSISAMDSIRTMGLVDIPDVIKDTPVTSISHADPETNHFAWIADINFFQIILITVLCIIAIYVIKIYKKLS